MEKETPNENLTPVTAANLSKKHILGIENMPIPEINALLERANYFANQPKATFSTILANYTVLNIFFENSTRTRVSFELAAKRLGASLLNISISGSSVKKGETLIDTATTLNAMRPDILVVRHHSSGAPLLLSQHVDAAVINAGDGRHEHPTQALLDALTIKRTLGRIAGLKIAICGDINNSRVARSNMYLLSALGADVRFVSPSTLVSPFFSDIGIPVFTDMEQGIAGCEIVMMLRLQTERMEGREAPVSVSIFNFLVLIVTSFKKLPQTPS